LHPQHGEPKFMISARLRGLRHFVTVDGNEGN